jgi:hypothetical protein
MKGDGTVKLTARCVYQTASATMLVPTPSNSHRASSACLASLPPELKTMIIGEVQACEDKFKGILALSVVDRVFATLVQPLLWKVHPSRNDLPQSNMLN